MMAPTGKRVSVGVAVLALCALVLAGCSSYVERSTLIKQALLAEDYEKALGNVEEIDRSTSELLYLYEKGLVLHYQDRFVESNEVFEQAELLLEDLYTKSVTRELAALVVKDDIAKYRGDPFEAVLVNYYKILNYLHLGDIEGALVECRRVNRKLQMIIDAGEESYENDPFLQYLTAMVYDAAGDIEDAAVSYRAAAEAYEDLRADGGASPPPSLLCDAARNASRLGDAEAAGQYEGDAPGDCPPRERERGALNVFLESGYVTHKTEESVVIPIYEDDDDYDDHDTFAVTLAERRHMARRKGVKVTQVVKIAMPVLVEDPVPFHHAVLRARPAGADADRHHESPVVEARTTLVEDVGVHARHAFTAKEGKILVRTIIRALAKLAAQNKAEDKDTALGVLVNIFNVATETADTRSWSTLPQRIDMARLQLPAGTWDVDVTLYNGSDERLDEFTITDVVVQSGESSFINYRVY